MVPPPSHQPRPLLGETNERREEVAQTFARVAPRDDVLLSRMGKSRYRYLGWDGGIGV